MSGCNDHDSEKQEKPGDPDENGTVLAGIAELPEAKRLRAALMERGVEVWLVSNPATCSTGKCGSKVELRVLAESLPELKAFLASERERSLEGLGADPRLLEQVYDASAEQATCPACGTTFSTQKQECPDCGLGFGVG